MKWPFFTYVTSLCIGIIVNAFSFLRNKSHKLRRDTVSFIPSIVQYPIRLLGSNFPQDDMEIIYLVLERVGNSCI